MGKIKLKWNESTQIIDVVEDIDQSEIKIEDIVEAGEKEKSGKNSQIRPEKIRNTISLIISILSIVVSVGALSISYSQKVTNEKQADINMRQFNLNKKPVFECYIEKEELYDETKYWELYGQWLLKKEIKNFNDWQHQFLAQEVNSYWDFDKQQVFWDAYDKHENDILNELTDGLFKDLENEYSKYLRSKDYLNYSQWKDRYIYEKDYITLKNTGAYITNAKLEVYTFLKYQLNIGDDISYSFAIDTNGIILNEYWEGNYKNDRNYDSGNNTFMIEYRQDGLGAYENERLELSNLLNFLSCNDIMTAIGLGESDIHAFYVIDRPVYFAINYLDIEQKEQTDWYRYSRESNTLYYVNTYNSDVELPDITKEGLDTPYYEARTLRAAKTLGYQNAQWRPFVSIYDYSYIEEAKQKIISDLKELVDNMQ